MKKRVLSLLLSVLLALTVLAPLAATVQAASTPSIIIFYSGGAGKIIAGSDNTYNFGAAAGISAKADPEKKALYLKLNGYSGSGVWIDAPSGWSTLAQISGSNKLTVQAPNTSYGINDYCALGSNRDLYMYALADGASLTITSAFTGTLTAGHYGIQAPHIEVNTFANANGSVRLRLTIDFNIKLGGYSSKEVYPFKVTAKNERVTVSNTDLTLVRHSDYGTANPENTPIDLTYATYLDSKTSNSAGTGHYGYHTLNYTADFTGVAHFETTNGSYNGGAYSKETYNNIGIGSFNGYRYFTTIDGVQYYHVVAKNSPIAKKMSKESMRKIYSFPMDKGYKMISSLNTSDYAASVKWNKVIDNSTGPEVTNQTAEYGVEYMATVTVVPKGLNYFTLEDGIACPPRASMAKSTVNINEYYMQSCMVFFYPVVKPDTKITLQPKDVNGYGTNTTGTFAVDTDDESASYQWQYLNGPTGTWIDLADDFSHGNTSIIGSKTKKLSVNFGALGVTLRYIRCKITGTVDGAAGVLYSDIVKYEYIQTTFKKIVIQNLDEPRAGKALDTSATTWTDAVTVSQVYYTKDGQKVTSVAAGDTVHIVVDLELNSAYTLDTKSSVAVWNDITCLKAYSGGTAYFLSVGANTYRCEFEYKVPKFITEIPVKNVRVPFNGEGFINDLPIIATTSSECYVGFRSGWHDGIRGSKVSPQVGKTYYVYLAFMANDGYRFTRDTGSLKFTFADLAGKTLTPVDIYVEGYRTIDGKDVVDTFIGFECNEVRVRRGTSILDLDAPQAGKRLDTDITVNSGNVEFSFIDYCINGQYITDADTQFPAAGDTVDIYVGVKTYSESWAFDDEIFAYWYLDRDNTGSPPDFITRRDWSYPVGPDVCVFRITWNVPKTSGNVITEVGFCHVAQPATGQKTDRRATPLHPEQIELLDFPQWKLYDQEADTFEDLDTSTSFTAGKDYVVRFIYKLRPGYSDAGGVKYVLYDHYGTKVDFYNVKQSKIGSTMYVDYYITAAARYPTLSMSKVTQITLLNVTAPAAGAEITSADTKLAEPVKIKFTQAEPTWKHKVDGEWKEIAAGEKFKAGDEYVLVFSVNANDINNLYYMAANKEELAVLLITPDGKALTPDKREITKYTIGNIGFAVKCYFTVKEGSGVMLGDVDKDSHITASDARLCLRRAVDLETYPVGSYEFTACDVDKSGSVTANDARSILRAAVDLEDPSKW
jgi:hypothetical protein